jgi:hypothetical protein
LEALVLEVGGAFFTPDATHAVHQHFLALQHLKVVVHPLQKEQELVHWRSYSTSKAANLGF